MKIPTPRRVPLALALGLLLGSTGCVTTQDVARTLQNNPDKLVTALAPKQLGTEDEKKLGRQSAALLLGAAPLVRNDALQAYVNRVGRWVALQSGREDIDWRFGVIDTPNVNAFAAPGGYVLITRGLLARLNNEAELAGVLGHEIAHVIERHYVKAAQKKEQAGALAGLAGDMANSGNKAMVAAALNVSRGIYSAGLDKGDEFDADRIGITLAARAGYHPYGLPRVLQMYGGHAQEAGFELFFSTHPGPGERLEKLAAVMDERFAALERSGVEQTPAFRQATGASAKKESASGGERKKR